MTDNRRRRRPPARERSRFARGAKSGNRDLIRFHRNRELLVREATVLVLWVAVAVMLLNLAGTLRTVAAIHLAERSALLRYSLPLIALAGSAFCIWRARLNWREFRDIRREQAETKRRLKSLTDDED